MTAAANQTTDAMAELTAMMTIAKALQSLDGESVRRVLQWAGDRFGITETTQRKPTLHSEPSSQSDTAPHKDIAELYAAAEPRG